MFSTKQTNNKKKLQGQMSLMLNSINIQRRNDVKSTVIFPENT